MGWEWKSIEGRWGATRTLDGTPVTIVDHIPTSDIPPPGQKSTQNMVLALSSLVCSILVLVDRILIVFHL